jgi:hypothetical protein
MNFTCFMLAPEELARRSLRRYHPGHGRDCRGGALSYHSASVVIEENVPYPTKIRIGASGQEGVIFGESGDDWPHEDPRWPSSCACGYAFCDGDAWQHNLDRLFSRSDGGPRTTLREAPVGAMWHAAWWPDDRGPDGLCLVVKTPGGEWMIDGRARDGGRWTRTGTPPRITVTPSILCGHGPEAYHGWLRDGVLVPA